MCTCFNLNISLPQEKEEKRLGRIEAAFRKFDLDGDGYLRWKDGKMGSSFKYIFMKNMSCTKQTLWIASLIEAKLSPFWLWSWWNIKLPTYCCWLKIDVKNYIAYCNAVGTSFSRLGLRRSLLGGSSTPVSRFLEQSFSSILFRWNQDSWALTIFLFFQMTLLFRWNQASWALTNSRVWPTGDLGLARSSLCFCFPFNYCNYTRLRQLRILSMEKNSCSSCLCSLSFCLYVIRALESFSYSKCWAS